MKEPRIYVDFNEMIEENLILLSKTDFKLDSGGNVVELKEGMSVKIYSDDLDENNNVDNLIAVGIVELNKYREIYSWTAAAKWNCRINERGIYQESDEKN